MLAPFTHLLAEAAAARRAVGAFSCHDLTQAQGVLDAAEERGRGVILLVPPAAFAARRGAALVAALTAAAAEAAVPACVQVDHLRSLDAVAAAVEAGAGAVMADGSHLPPPRNAAFVAAAVALAAARGAAVECELVGLAGEEDVALLATPAAFTDPAAARTLLRDGGGDCLAVAIGNVHGRYAAPPRLDLARLGEIAAALPDTPLALHGASGLPPEQLRAAIAGGIAKVNVNTELRRRALAVLDAGLPAALPEARLLALLEQVRAATAAATAEQLALLDG